MLNHKNVHKIIPKMLYLQLLEEAVSVEKEDVPTELKRQEKQTTNPKSLLKERNNTLSQRYIWHQLAWPIHPRSSLSLSLSLSLSNSCILIPNLGQHKKTVIQDIKILYSSSSFSLYNLFISIYKHAVTDPPYI